MNFGMPPGGPGMGGMGPGMGGPMGGMNHEFMGDDGGNMMPGRNFRNDRGDDHYMHNQPQ
jgi:hypothetical protein